MIYHRFRETDGLLTEEDYPNWKGDDGSPDLNAGGFGIDYDLMARIREAKKSLGIEKPLREKYDNRTGFTIDMSPFNNTYHPIFQFDLLDTETGKQLQIDGYSSMNWYGEHWVISAMDKDTRSHRMIMWDKGTCHDPDTIERILENKKQYKLVPAETPRWSKDGLKCLEK